MRTPKYALGDEIVVEFMGRIVKVEYDAQDELSYKVVDAKNNAAYIKESCLYPLVIPPGGNNDSR